MSDEEKKERRLTERQLWFIWTVINELQGYLNDAIEGGAAGQAIKDSDRANRAKDLIQQQRRFLKQQNQKP